MYRDITVAGFRCFERFALRGLVPVNLLVGSNNSGKTSLLEAIGLMTSGGDWRFLSNILTRRGELAWQESSRSGVRRPVQTPRVKHLFWGHDPLGSAIVIEGSSQSGRHESLRLSVEVQDQRQLFDSAEERLFFKVAWRNGEPQHYEVPVLESGELDPDWRRSRSTLLLEDVSFVTTAALGQSEVARLASSIQLTAEEGQALEALRIVEPKAEAFRPLPPQSPFGDYHSREGIIVRLEGAAQPVPIGSLGDGAWRILGLALSLAGASGKVLLVDEIDTGLHYSVMVDMWRMMLASAQRLNVQVFATTHSRDCIEALATLAEELGPAEELVGIHRIDKEQHESTAYSQSEIVAAAARGIEVR